jgi:NhaP-type Na+/H+ or K+/H+ antiporter
MVLPVHMETRPERPKWKRWTIRLIGASALCSLYAWLVGQDARGTLIAATLPWAVACGCVAVSMLMATVTVPLMLLIGKLSGRGNQR